MIQHRFPVLPLVFCLLISAVLNISPYCEEPAPPADSSIVSAQNDIAQEFWKEEANAPGDSGASGISKPSEISESSQNFQSSETTEESDEAEGLKNAIVPEPDGAPEEPDAPAVSETPETALPSEPPETVKPESPAPSAAASETPLPPPAETRSSYKTLQDLKNRLDYLHESAAPALGSDLPSLYMEADARLAEGLHLVKKGGDSEISREMFKSCSLLVEAASADLMIIRNRFEINRLQDKRDSVLMEMNTTYRKINQIERSYAMSLRQNLEEERQKTLERQDKARERLQMLQSDLINVRKDARGIILSMSDILFDVNQATLKSELKTNLAKIAGILFVYKEANVIVEGHTDNVGAAEYNQKLSEKRAQNVMAFLVKQGVPEQRLKALGFGLTKPVADNTTNEGRQKNRRVDLVISDTSPEAP